jgi:hypothetical protein
MGADKKMTDNPHYFVLWEQDGAARSITFDSRKDCQEFVKVIHKREGYKKGSVRIITGFELEVERDGS